MILDYITLLMLIPYNFRIMGRIILNIVNFNDDCYWHYWEGDIWEEDMFLDNAVCSATRGNLYLVEPSAILQTRTQPS